MGRGLSKLQRLILDQAKTRKAVLFEEICAMLCMPPCQAVMETLANGDYENRGHLPDISISCQPTRLQTRYLELGEGDHSQYARDCRVL